MIRERIADDIYVFTSRRYAQVTAGAILTKEGVVLIDTLHYPDESKQIRDFLENRLGQHIRYVINTHYHADHTTGTYLFPQATVISHATCRELINTVGRDSLTKIKAQLTEFQDVDVILPNLIVRNGTVDISIGGKKLRLIHLPGHCEDLMGVLVLNNNILFASDTMMPVPTFFDGNYEQLISSMKIVAEMEPETVVQGHGEVILRGEVNHIVQDHIDYMERIREEVLQVIEEGLPQASLDNISIEACGKSRIPLNGHVSELHTANLHRLYEDLSAKMAD